jgi:tRNA modification GTPase
LKVELEKIKNQFPLKPLVIIGNKADKLTETEIQNIKLEIPEILLISAKEKLGVEDLKNQLLSFVNTGALRNNETIVTNTRHYDSLLKALDEIQKVKFGLETNLSSDLMALDIKEALYQFGMITGQVTNDELLGNIFANFCIGK